MKRITLLAVAAAFVLSLGPRASAPAARQATQAPGNRPERLDWFRDLGKHPMITVYGEEKIVSPR